MIVWGGSRHRHRRPLQPLHRRLVATSTGANCPPRVRPHGGMDGQRDDRLGWVGSLRLLEHRRALQPVHRQLAADLDRRERALRASGTRAVWTGSEMIVWGRWIGWRPQHRRTLQPVHRQLGGDLDRRELPSARADHTAVWTGSEMIVWGGTIGTIRTPAGATTRPPTSGWRPRPARTCPPRVAITPRSGRAVR